MDNNEFPKLLDNFSLKFNMLSSSANLKQVKSSYEELEKHREEIIEWVSNNTSSPEQSAEYFLEFGKFEDNLWYDYQKNELIGGIPSFDSNLSIDELYNLFDEHNSYFMRYGCINSDHIVSWDEKYVLIEDELGNITRVKRPDILLSGIIDDDEYDEEDETEDERQKREQGYC